MEGRSYKSNDSQMPLMDLAVKYCLKKRYLIAPQKRKKYQKQQKDVRKTK